MDPNACWKRFLDAAADEDIREACDALNDLSNWLNKGGALPDCVPTPRVVHTLLVVHGMAIKRLEDLKHAE